MSRHKINRALATDQSGEDIPELAAGLGPEQWRIGRRVTYSTGRFQSHPLSGTGSEPVQLTCNAVAVELPRRCFGRMVADSYIGPKRRCGTPTSIHGILKGHHRLTREAIPVRSAVMRTWRLQLSGGRNVSLVCFPAVRFGFYRFSSAALSPCALALRRSSGKEPWQQPSAGPARCVNPHPPRAPSTKKRIAGGLG